jgi:probable F420-dependent oxidoreductase
MRPFRFAVQSSRTPTVAAWRDLARKCEDLGYSCLYIPDHFEDQFGPIVALTVAAEATTALRVGSLVFDNDYRHPVVLAKEIATLDLASEGRVEFGIGAGWLTTDYNESGIPLDPAGVRVARMVEGLTVMKGLWSSEKFSFSGEHYTITDASGLPRPHTEPHPPIVIGGGSKRILTIAGREAEIVGINPDLRSGVIGPEVIAGLSPDKWDERVQWVRDGAGDRFDSLELQILTFLVQIGSKPKQQVVEETAPLFGLPEEVAAQMPIAMVGTVDEVCADLIARRERWGFNYVVVHEPEIEAFIPVVERLAGT